MRRIKKAQTGDEVIKGSRPGLGVFRTEKKRTTVGGIAKPYEYKRTSIDTTGYSKGKPSYKVKTETGEGDKVSGSRVKSRSSKTISRKEVPSTLRSLQQKRSGGKIKPKASNVSKKLGSAKKSIGNMRFTKKKK